MLKTVPCGRVTTYGDLAKALGRSGASRAVGRAMNTNPNAPTVPCHRVVMSDGCLGGFAFGINKKIKILQQEGIKIENEKVVDFAVHS